ncbi:hypothetical protein HanRHA438_Chr17g0793101 [Helianthus annuus]|uniref:Amino acid/polyamine transporter I n=1 Tax=Helianthus annuus TaxID=4232 RepID=A0A9K3DGY7_HELAN|nr:hypothetical protein HanXRQr2_Chr17g0782471 [Helianthus annuus]KAJ0811440.1 hypothetical protein HanPSC8_Chr17g0750711 [Helianthus annuus]KAJ0824503.1 hypothetical protein HanRHA438_Chr17g0793101 [Helianthus annuus]
MAVGLSISEICLSYPTSGGLYSWRNLLVIVGHPFPLGSLAGYKTFYEEENLKLQNTWLRP